MSHDDARALLRLAQSAPARRLGVLVGGSGLVGGTLLHHFKQGHGGEVDLLAPNSKELSLRVADDVRAYFEKVRPDFVVNCAIAALDSDPQLTFEVNCLGAVYLARAARELGIPYIHLSSAALLPSGLHIPEEKRLTPSPGLSNYARGKLLAELALERMRADEGLDYTCIRLAVVYGAHDHKIQGFHRLLFALVNGSMPALLTRPDSRHSYSNAKKLPGFVAHVLDHREEFGGETVHFVDPEPVHLAELILTVKRHLGRRTPHEIYVPYGLARVCVAVLPLLARMVNRIGIEARAPAEAVFLRDFYQSQVLSSEKLRRSSWVDPAPEATIFTELPEILDYYVRRWEQLNLVEARSRRERARHRKEAELFRAPEKLLESVLSETERPFLRQCPVDTPRPEQADAPGPGR